MNLRIKVVLLFTAALLIGYVSGILVTDRKHNEKVEEINSRISNVNQINSDLEKRLDSLCGDAILKFVPCDGALEVCICGDPNGYLKKED